MTRCTLPLGRNVELAKAEESARRLRSSDCKAIQCATAPLAVRVSDRWLTDFSLHATRGTRRQRTERIATWSRELEVACALWASPEPARGARGRLRPTFTSCSDGLPANCWLSCRHMHRRGGKSCSDQRQLYAPMRPGPMRTI